MIKKLHAYVLKAFIGPWMVTFIVCVFLLLMQFLWRYIDDLVGKGLDWTVILELMFYASFSLVPLALPLAGLLASIMTMGKLGETNELFAMKSGGVSLYRIMSPLIVLNIFISLGAFYFSNNLMPYTNLKMRSLLFSIQQQRPEVNIQNGIFAEPTDDIWLKVDRKNKSSNRLEGVLIYDHRNSASPNNVTMAKTGKISITNNKSVMLLELNNGTRHEDVKGHPYQHQRTSFDNQTVYLDLGGAGLDRNNEEFFKGGYEMLDNSQLNYTIDSLNNALSDREQVICGNFKRFSLFKGLNTIYVNTEGNFAPVKVKPIMLVAKDESIVNQINVDSLYSKMTNEQKQVALDFALNYTRSAKTYIDIVSDEIMGTRRWITRHEMEWYRKYALSAACLLFCLVGIPLGAVIRKGGFGFSVVISVFIFLLYYILSTTIESTVKELVTPVLVGMWLSTAILLPIGLYLVIAIANDSLRINPQFMQKITNIFKLKRKKEITEDSD